jgi:hypothetical protein
MVVLLGWVVVQGVLDVVETGGELVGVALSALALGLVMDCAPEQRDEYADHEPERERQPRRRVAEHDHT